MLCDVGVLFQKHTASCLAKVKGDLTSQHNAVWCWDSHIQRLPTPQSRREDLYMNLYEIEKSTKNSKLPRNKLKRKTNISSLSYTTVHFQSKYLKQLKSIVKASSVLIAPF